MSVPGNERHLADLRADLLRFLAAARHPLGFGWLRDDGSLDEQQPVHLYVTCRMTHVAALASVVDDDLRDAPGSDDLHNLAAHGIASLAGPLHDDEHGGWFATVDDGGPADDGKDAYAHAFVVLAAASAAQADVPGARDLLATALDVAERQFWDEDAGLVVERWNRAWSTLDEYRGVNSNMHTVEAFLAAGDVTGDAVWHERADQIATRVVGWASDNDWRIPEHFDSAWQPMLDFNREQPADPFRPYGATVGHGLEWSRLLLGVDLALGRDDSTGHHDAAVAIHDRAVADGWAVDGAEGFVYTTDWDGTPVVRQRMHWVLAEAVASATALHRATGEQRFADRAATWWAYADRHLVDHVHGSWHHELDPQNRPASTVWSGKPDVYHAYQAALLPVLPPAPSFAGAVGLLADEER